MAPSLKGNLRGKAAATHNREIRESLSPVRKQSIEERIEFLKAMLADQIRLAKSWKNNPVIRHGHIVVAKTLRDEIAALQGAK